MERFPEMKSLSLLEYCCLSPFGLSQLFLRSKASTSVVVFQLLLCIVDCLATRGVSKGASLARWPCPGHVLLDNFLKAIEHLP